MAKGYLPYEVDQQLLLPRDMRAWLPDGHLALFVVDVVAELDLSEFYAVHDAKDTRGRAGDQEDSDCLPQRGGPGRQWACHKLEPVRQRRIL